MAVRRNWKQIFLTSLAKTGNVRASCVKAGVTRKTPYEVRGRDPRFAEAWESAIEEAVDLLEAEARRRAIKGVKRVKGVYYQGDRIATETIVEYSDTLMALLLKAHRPAKFRERYEITGAEGGPVTFAEIAQNVVRRRTDRKS